MQPFIDDASYLQLALEEAKIRRGFCAPNPAVGAVIVKANQILSSGYHFAAGAPHAEVDALAKINQEAAHGATLYITLEPCCHWGKTPPCTDLIIQRNISRVVYGQHDPNPLVAQQSRIQLEKAGIECVYLPSPEISEFYRSYLYSWATNLPWTTAKIALSLDGKIAGKNGERLQITGKTAQQFTHQQRKNADAILSTAATVLCDDPLFTVRLDGRTFSKPIYILDRQLRLTAEAQIFLHNHSVTLLHEKNAPAEKQEYFSLRGIRTQEISADQNGLALSEVLKIIRKDGAHDLWIEAGGKCFSAFVQQKLLNRAYLYIGLKWLGSTAISSFTDDFSLTDNLKSIHWQALGEDALCQLDFNV